ncbi:Zn-dependent hydrolase of the beta-lactamase fold-like protein [Caldicellulosiruptor obsidiansis OB47]|uniref:Zn-dependent hydrolase of the beta-lactamase fold-like protein n=1 Tax=Caldicellulosiruptor obsidiansis (strain ATCC BAA-2073 / JCM 16842 / OB47) TaxID=608506 RepID=D9TGT8_CALOO|nr:MBL fold metallo-hydrolase [Caldicellulosiruptor obsidiansis]ADL41424.1 Zn-dependent hydrolase of the beta-lactamase fold-like protein [Caldicellulosiruptor obsidiansis OB47]
MKITYLAHASFLIETESRVKIITDPYDSSVGYTVFELSADVVLTSHKHFDHAYTKSLKGDYVLVDKEGEFNVKGVKIKGIKTFHDKEKGQKRGENIVFVIEDKFSVAHLGDLGHELAETELEKMGRVDILLIPVGGVYTINAKEALNVAKAINPKIIIPMHYKTEKLKFDLGKVEEFTKHFEDVEVLQTSEIEINSLPEKQKVLVLKYKG